MIHKNLPFILIATFLLIQSIAQAQPLRLVEISKTNNSFTPLDTIPNVTNGFFIFPDFSAFNQLNNHFVIRMTDLNNQERLYSLDASSGAIISNPIVSALTPEDQISEFQFDNSTGELFGIQRITNNAIGLKYCLVSINTITGNHAVIDTLDYISGFDYYQGRTAFDPIKGHYIFSSENNTQPDRLYSVDVTNGNVIHNPLFPVLADSTDELIHLQFDDSTGNIYGLLYDASLYAYYLVTVDPITGLHSTIDSISGLKSVNPTSHRVTFDPINRLYIFQGQEANTAGYLYSINVNDASIASKRPFSLRTNPDSISTPYYLHLQNSTGKLLGITWMNDVTTSLEEGSINDNITVYPNPFSNQLTIEISELEPNIELNLFDVRGKLIYSQQFLNSHKFELSRGDWASGVYFLQIRSNTSNYMQKVVIE
tara:strand:+ start:288 stop:1565 length:1278 start_codon:yes stop_codon:yes gene_type:complete